MAFLGSLPFVAKRLEALGLVSLCTSPKSVPSRHGFATLFAVVSPWVCTAVHPATCFLLAAKRVYPRWTPKRGGHGEIREPP